MWWGSKSVEERFSEAVIADNVQKAQSLLKENPALLYNVIKDGWTQKNLELWECHVKIAEMLIAEHPKLLDAVDKDGNTALHIAAKNGHVKIAEMLIAEHPKLLDAVDNNGNTALHWAAWNGQEEIAELLIAKNPKLLDAVDNNGNTALHWAAWNGQEEIAELLIAKNPKLLDAVDNNGNTALHWAALERHEKVVEILIAASPKLLDVVNKYGNTALHWAAKNGHVKIAELLISKHPKLFDAVNKDGDTALHWAAKNGHVKIAELLISKHPKLFDAVNKDGDTALLLAAWKGHAEIAEMLIAKNPKLLDAVDNNGNTALHWAARERHEKVVEILIAASPKLLGAVNKDGDTALLLAAWKGHEKVVEILIAASPKLLDAVNKDSWTALHVAARDGREKIAEMLIAKSPKLLDAVNKDGKNALHLAAENGNEKVVQILSKAMYALALQRKDLKEEENKTANKSDQESKKFYYSQEKIHKLLLAQLQNEKNANVELLDLSNQAKDLISVQQLQKFVDSAIKGNKTLAIALHLHGEAWASLVIKHIGDYNLQLIYNDPTGNAFSKEPAVLELITSLTEQNQRGGTNTIDLKKSQQIIEADSGAIVVDNLIKITTAKSLKKADLQKLLLEAGQVNELKVKHLLLEETSPDYSDHKLAKLLELSLADKPIIIIPTTAFENKDLLIENTKVATLQVMDSGVTIIIPLWNQGKGWSGLVVKKQLDGSLQVIYSNPMGDALGVEKNSKSLIAAIMELNSEVHIFDVRCKQEDNKQASGVFTVNNLVKLASSDTSNFHKKDFQKLLSTSENVDGLYHQQRELLNGYIMSDLIRGSVLSNLEMDGERKVDKPEGKEEHAAPPPYEEDPEVQIHVLGQSEFPNGNGECTLD